MGHPARPSAADCFPRRAGPEHDTSTRLLRRASQDQRVRNTRMKWPKWSIATSNSGDPMPILFGAIFLFLSLPGFLMVLFNSDPNSGGIKMPLLIVLGG